jgi:hypothetical protein
MSEPEKIDGVEIEKFYLFGDPALPAYRARFPHRVIVESSLEALKDRLKDHDSDWESRKAKLRARLKAEHLEASRTKTVTTREEIAIRDAAYWTHPPELRLKYAKEAEEARAKWAKIPGSVWYQPKHERSTGGV